MRAIRLAFLSLSVAISACATAQMHSEEELNTIGTQCGLSTGELFQDESEKRLLFLVRIQPAEEEASCISRWARRNHLNLVVIQDATFSEH